MSFVSGTTPTFSFTISGRPNLDEAEKVIVTFEQGNTHIDLTGDQVTVIGNNKVSCFLPQEQSLKLNAKASVSVQVNWIYTTAGGQKKRGATKMKAISVDEQLLRRVIE